MNNSITILTSLLLTCIYIITIKVLKFKMKNKQLAYYSVIVLLISFIASKLFIKSWPEYVSSILYKFRIFQNLKGQEDKLLNKLFQENVEHLSKKEKEDRERERESDRVNIVKQFENKMLQIEEEDRIKYDNVPKKKEHLAKKCMKLEKKIVDSLISSIGPIIKKMEKDPYKYGVCTKKDRKKCNKLDMSKFVLKESVPTCDYVLPEQYNLYKKRKGYVPGDHYEDPTLNNIINKDNYVIYFTLFAILIAIYIGVLIFKSIFI